MQRRLVFVLMACLVPQLLQADDADEAPTCDHVEQMLAASNAVRAEASRPPHRLSEQLTRAAQDHATWMASTRIFSHYANGGPGGRARRYGFVGAVRENIAYGYADVGTAFRVWRNSSGHRANLLSDSTLAGFGLARTAGGTPYWVALYGSEAGASPACGDVAVSGETLADASPGRRRWRRRN